MVHMIQDLKKGLHVTNLFPDFPLFVWCRGMLNLHM